MDNILNKALFITLAVTCICGLIACKDFLNEPPQGSLDEATLANQTGVEGNLTGSYAMLDGYDTNIGPAFGASGSNWIMGGIASDNAHKGIAPGVGQGREDIELWRWSLSTADQQINDRWEVLYEGVNRANTALKQLKVSGQDISETDKNRIRGEALTLRAHYHFEAYKQWQNIPFLTEDIEDFDVPNTEPALPKILADINNAIELLPPTQEEVGRVTKWTAKALKGRILMFDQQFEEAITVLQDVVNNGPFRLEDTFWQVFSAFNDNGPETIFAFQATVNDGDPTGANGNWGDRLNFPHSGSPFGCCGGFQPSQNLVNAFQVDESGLPLPVTQPDNWNFRDDQPGSDVPVDPRLDWTVGRSGVPFLDWGIHEIGWIRAPEFGGPYSNKKNIWEQSSNAKSNVGWSTFQLHWKNLHLLRFADVILYLAEAYVETGQLENARMLVNLIRERAAQTAQGPVDNIEVPLEDNGDGTFSLQTDWANYQIGLYEDPWTDQAFARRAVRVERRLELAQEGHRLFDLRRWDVDQEVLRSYIEVEQNRRPFLSGASPFQERHDLYPIPNEQMDLTNELQQNPGW